VNRWLKNDLHRDEPRGYMPHCVVMEERNFKILTYVARVPSMACCEQCRCKFFTPRNDFRGDGASAENYLREKFAQHRCSQPETNKFSGHVKETLKIPRRSCLQCGYQTPPAELGRLSMTPVRCPKCGTSLLLQSASA
jgi:hypothetical protein